MKGAIYLPLLFLAVSMLSGCSASAGYDLKSATVITCIVCIWTLFFGLAIYSNLLRDPISDCDTFETNAKLREQTQKGVVDRSAPFSLTKVQFGLWTAIISSVYVYLSLFKGDCAGDGLNKTALVLMGIFAGTAVASSFIDQKDINDNKPRHQNTPSRGFFMDILSDENGISLHRFQNFAWTLIAIIVYLYKVSEIKSGCLLPELSDTLLALTGISSATYLVLKTKENTPASPQPVNGQEAVG